MIKKFLAVALALVLVFSLAACDSGESEKGSETNTAEGTSGGEQEGEKHPVVTITMEDGGVMKLELYPETAPITVENFINLAKEGFYDGLTFHRIISGFMIQGGDPLGTGMGGSEKNIKGEFASNGVKNDLSHKRGVISMARSMDKNSASSQFFICHADATSLDGDYAAFGMMTEGFDVLDRLADTPVIDNNGTVARENQPVIKTITVEE